MRCDGDLQAEDRRGEPIGRRLWRRIDVGHPTECWPFEGHTTSSGYGEITIDGRAQRVHRATWEDFYGPVPDGAFVLHRCDVRACANPYHLFLGDTRTNMEDMVAKDRSARGSRNAAAKLTPVDVRAIRQSGLSQSQLAALYDVAKSTIQRVRAGSNWRHVEMAGA